MEDVLTESTRAISGRLISDVFFGGSRLPEHKGVVCVVLGSQQPLLLS